MIPKRGEVWWADLGIAAKIRPVVVVSVAYSYGDYALITVVPHTTSPRGAAFEVDLTIPQLKHGAFNLQGILSVPPRVFERRVATLTSDQMARLEHGIKAWFGV